MGHQMGHAAFSSIRFTQFRVYMMLPEHAVYIISTSLKSTESSRLLEIHDSREPRTPDPIELTDAAARRQCASWISY